MIESSTAFLDGSGFVWILRIWWVNADKTCIDEVLAFYTLMANNFLGFVRGIYLIGTLSIWIMIRGGRIWNWFSWDTSHKLAAKSFWSRVETGSSNGVKTLSGFMGIGFLGCFWLCWWYTLGEERWVWPISMDRWCQLVSKIKRRSNRGAIQVWDRWRLPKNLQRYTIYFTFPSSFILSFTDLDFIMAFLHCFSPMVCRASMFNLMLFKPSSFLSLIIIRLTKFAMIYLINGRSKASSSR